MKTQSKSPKDAAALLDEIRQLLELAGENPFKIRAFERAAPLVGDCVDLVERAREGRLTELEGIGKGIAEILTEFLLEGHCRVRDELQQSLPRGLLEIARLPGLGPKKARFLIEELAVHSVPELEEACRRNRLVELKGFGPKAQEKILNGIVFFRGTRGQTRLGDALDWSEKASQHLQLFLNRSRHPVAEPLRVSETGALRRRLEVLNALEFLVELPSGKKWSSQLRAEVEEETLRFLRAENLPLPIQLHFATPESFGFELAKTTGSESHWKALGTPEPPVLVKDEEEFYASLELPWVAPEMRESGEEVALARAKKLAAPLQEKELRGFFHAHTTRSDGAGTLEEMVRAAKEAGFQYIGISDHSQSAHYANGLKEPDLLEQEKEVRKLQENWPDIRILWGIESDIRVDGSLDYSNKILKRFDFVIASVHSRFNLDRKAMTERIVKAVRNPNTRFLGHMTGRLLLERSGYEVDTEAVVKETAACNVAIEINSHPARLDIDWRWGGLLRKYGTKVSINPDAHSLHGISDTRFGVWVARKALLPSRSVVNTWSLEEVQKWLSRRLK